MTCARKEEAKRKVETQVAQLCEVEDLIKGTIEGVAEDATAGIKAI